MVVFRVGRRCIKRCISKHIFARSLLKHSLPRPSRHLKPGYGHLEQVEIDLRPRCDDGTLPEKPVVQWFEWLEDATNRASRSISYPGIAQTRQMLEAQGFVEIQETIIRLPLNSWPSERHPQDVGRWYNMGMCEYLEALSLGPLTRVYRWPAEDVRRLVGEVKFAMCNKKIHAYNNLQVFQDHHYELGAKHVPTSDT